MNIEHASTPPFARPVARESRLRSFLLALGLAGFALVALVVTAVLLFLSARAQMKFQTSPTDIKYAPAQRIPAATPDERSSREDDDDDDDGEDSAPGQPGGYPGGIVPGRPGLGAGPLFPTAPQAPSYTPAPAPPSRTQPPLAVQPVSPKNKPESAQPTTKPSEPVARPRASGRDEGSAPDVGRVRRVGGKSFKRDGTGVLVDTAYVAKSGLEEVTLVAGSDAYVSLLESRQDLRPYFRLDDRLIVVVDNIVYRVVPKD